MSECKDLALVAFNEKPQINITTHTHISALTQVSQIFSNWGLGSGHFTSAKQHLLPSWKKVSTVPDS